MEILVGKVSLRVHELIVKLETKTKDNVFVEVHTSVQYQVNTFKGLFPTNQLKMIAILFVSSW